MSSHHFEKKLEKDGTLILTDLPFRAGETVEVVIVSKSAEKNTNLYSLQGKPIKYESPFEPIAQDDWEILK